MGPGLASADEVADAKEAKMHYSKAQSAFAVGDFAVASKEYQEAYRLKQDAALLFNAAQSARLAGDNEKALILYKNYAQFYPKAKNLKDVREQITKLQEAIAAADEAKKAQPQGTMEATHEQPPQQQQAQPQQQAQVEKQHEPEKPPVPVYKKWWLWTIVGVVVVGAAVGIGVGVATAPKWSTLPDQGPGVSQGLTTQSLKMAEVRW